MAAFLLFVLAAAGGVVVGNLVWENTAAVEVTVFNQPVTAYPQGWLLAASAALGSAITLLLSASVNATEGRRKRRRQLPQLRRHRHRPVTESEPEHTSMM